jgi:16S rRNA G966 N2-methylase RsmD
MPVQQFILDYVGTKYQESKHIEILNIDFDKYETIIEPFGGSFGFSRYLHEKKKLTHLNYIIYDNDEDLIKFYQYFKSLIIENKHIDFINEYNEEVQKIKDNCSLINKHKNIDGKELKVYLKNYKHENIYMYYLVQKNHGHLTRFTRAVFKKNCGFLELIKSATFIFSNFEDIDDDILTNKKTLIYFDPPYIATDNSTYKNINLNKAFEKMIEIYKLVPCLMVHQYNFLLSYVFKDYKQHVYDKQYGATKKNVKHHLIYNF